MKKRVLSLALALAVVLSLVPAALAYEGQTSRGVPAPAQQTPTLMESIPAVTGWEERTPYQEPVSAPGTKSLYGASISEAQVYQTLIGLRDVYPEGMHWTNEDNVYKLSVPIYDERDGKNWNMTGYGCVAFCFLLSDAAFGSLSARYVYDFTYDDVHVGDILRINNDTHSVIVLEKYSDHVVLAEGNYNSSVHWGRTLTRDQVMRADKITTRYPSSTGPTTPALTSLNISVDKSTVLPGEKVTVTVNSAISSNYNITIWRGAKGTGELAWEDYNISPGDTYWFSTETAGSYTVYVEARNANGQLISGTAAFKVSGSKPSNVKVSTDKSVYSIGETVTISYSGSDAVSYSISIWQGDTQVAHGDGYTGSKITYQPKTSGTYRVYVEAVNSFGTASATGQFSVRDGKPSNVKVSTDKSSYSVGETVTISYSASDAASFNISIWQGAYSTGTRVASGDGYTNGKATYQPKAAGIYTLYVEAVNSYGTASATCQFSVLGSGPSNLKLTTDRSNFVMSEPFRLTVTATDMTGYNFELWRGGYGTGTLTTSERNVSPDKTITVTPGSVNDYTIYVEAYNDYGKTTATMSFRTAASIKFTDVPSNVYYANAVDWAVNNDVTAGTTATTFSPNDTVTRAQAVSFLWRAMGRPSPVSSYNPFTDVNTSAYYYQAVQWAVENGIVYGMSDTEFAPDGYVTRGQMITFLWRTQGEPGKTGQGEWYSDAENWARANSLLSGTSVSYATNAYCPRSDVIYYLWNALT